MKKIVVSISLALAVISCKNEGSTSQSGTENTELTQESKDASYSFGVSVGQQVEQFSSNPANSDSIVYSEVSKGVEDYLKDPEKYGSYALGLRMGAQIKSALDNPVLKGKLSQDEVIKGMNDFLEKKDMRVSVDSIDQVMNNFYQKQMTEKASEVKKEGEAFLAKKKQEEGVQSTPSGLVYKVVKEGTGEKAQLGDKVKVKYTGKTIDGKVFDSTDKGASPDGVLLPLQQGQLIPGWIEALQLMNKGSKYELYIPSDLAYGDMGSGPDIRGGETLIFDIEVVDIEKGGK